MSEYFTPEEFRAWSEEVERWLVDMRRSHERMEVEWIVAEFARGKA